MFKKPIWSAIETALFYYSGDMYNRASLVLRGIIWNPLFIGDLSLCEQLSEIKSLSNFAPQKE
jgi:hypothetical protein